MSNEMKEAMDAEECALSSLRMVQEKLKSASTWGWCDILGGGFFATMIKHSKMEDAQRFMESAKTDLKRFQKELKDVNIPLDLRMEVGSFQKVIVVCIVGAILILIVPMVFRTIF